MNADLRTTCWSRVHELYGKNPDAQIKQRLQNELQIIHSNESPDWYVKVKNVVNVCEQEGYHVLSKGTTGSSFVNYLYGISYINPLEPHYRCPMCQYTEFSNDKEYKVGCDLPPKKCPKCGTTMIGDGMNIPMESYFGVTNSIGAKSNISIGVSPIHFKRLCNKPIFKNEEAYMMPHWGLEMCKLLENITLVKVKDIPIVDPLVMKDLLSFSNIPEKMQRIIRIKEPDSFDDIIRVLSLYFSYWTDENYMFYGLRRFRLTDFICTREDIFEYMIKMDVTREEAYYFMEKVRTGRGRYLLLEKEGIEICEKYKLPSWLIATISGIKYLPSRAGMVSDATMLMSLLWYWRYYPKEFCLACPLKCRSGICDLKIVG